MVEPPRDPHRLQLYVEGGKKTKKPKKRDNRLGFLGDVGSVEHVEEHQQNAIDGALMITVPTPDKARKGGATRKKKEVVVTGELTRGNTVL